jgi:hypothetical protein
MRARLGTPDFHEFSTPRESLLREITGLEPERGGIHVLLDEHLGTRSTQRLAVADVGGSVLVGLWPAELKAQAAYLYTDGRAEAMIRAARQRGWAVEPTPHLAFFTAHPLQRLYMEAAIDAEAYARRWEREDGKQIRQYKPEEVRNDLWPWLLERAYVSPSDEPVREEFLRVAGGRPTHLRPGLSFKKRWQLDRAQVRHFAKDVRRELNQILNAADEPTLPTL